MYGRNFLKTIRFEHLLLAAALPPAAWFTAAVSGAGMKPEVVVSAVSFRLFYLFLCLLLAVRLFSSLVRRRISAAATALGLLLLLAQGAAWYGFRFHGEAGAGIGEQIVQYHLHERGVWAGDTRIPARVETILPGKEGAIEFSIGQQREKIPAGGSFVWKRFMITPLAIETAPLVKLESARGATVESVFIKLKTLPADREFIQLRTLPHRIYLKQTVETGMRVQIMRNKLEIAKKDLAWGEKLYFDGHYISFEKGEPWVRISVDRLLKPYSAIAGAALLAAGLALRIRRPTEHAAQSH